MIYVYYILTLLRLETKLTYLKRSIKKWFGLKCTCNLYSFLNQKSKDRRHAMTFTYSPHVHSMHFCCDYLRKLLFAFYSIIFYFREGGNSVLTLFYLTVLAFHSVLCF